MQLSIARGRERPFAQGRRELARSQWSETAQPLMIEIGAVPLPPPSLANAQRRRQAPLPCSFPCSDPDAPIHCIACMGRLLTLRCSCMTAEPTARAELSSCLVSPAPSPQGEKRGPFSPQSHAKSQ